MDDAISTRAFHVEKRDNGDEADEGYMDEESEGYVGDEEYEADEE